MGSIDRYGMFIVIGLVVVIAYSRLLATPWAAGTALCGRCCYAATSMASEHSGMRVLELDLDVYQGPFDLLLSLVLKEEIDLLEVPLLEVILAYLDQMEEAGPRTTGTR